MRGRSVTSFKTVLLHAQTLLLTMSCHASHFGKTILEIFLCQSNEFDFHLKQHKNNNEVLLLDAPQKEIERERE